MNHELDLTISNGRASLTAVSQNCHSVICGLVKDPNVRSNWVVVTGNWLSNVQVPSGSIVQFPHLLLQPIRVCVESVVIVQVGNKVQSYFLANVVADINATDSSL